MAAWIFKMATRILFTQMRAYTNCKKNFFLLYDKLFLIVFQDLVIYKNMRVETKLKRKDTSSSV